jgi:hypothetical protein
LGQWILQDGKPKDLSKGNDFISIAIDSVRRIFTKSEDEYPRKEPALGFTQTPTKPQRNKVRNYLSWLRRLWMALSGAA